MPWSAISCCVLWKFYYYFLRNVCIVLKMTGIIEWKFSQRRKRLKKMLCITYYQGNENQDHSVFYVFVFGSYPEILWTYLWLSILVLFLICLGIIYDDGSTTLLSNIQGKCLHPCGTSLGIVVFHIIILYF